MNFRQPEGFSGCLKFWGMNMWHIVLIGYVFTTMMFSLAQPSIARALIYLVFWTILPTVFVVWVAVVRRRNKLTKLAEQREFAEKQNLPNPNNEQI